MLIVRRREGESLVIGEGVEVVVLECGAGRRVKLGIIGPPEVNVYRKELALTRRQNRLAAAESHPQRVAAALAALSWAGHELDGVHPVHLCAPKKRLKSR
jgi:carbon storage regulator CsrA